MEFKMYYFFIYKKIRYALEYKVNNVTKIINLIYTVKGFTTLLIWHLFVIPTKDNPYEKRFTCSFY